MRIYRHHLMCLWCSLLAVLMLHPSSAWAEDPVRLRFVFGAETEAERAALLDGIRRFEEEYPGIEVEPVPFQWSGYGFHDTLVRLLALEDSSVDVYRIDVPWVPELAAPGWLLPLEDRIDESERANYYPITLEGGSHRGQLYALPLSLKGNLLFYRADLLEKHGLEPPQTLAELNRQGSLLRRAEGLRAGLALHPAYFYNDILPMLWASGGAVLDDNRAVVLDSEVNAQVLETVAGMVGPGPDAAVPLARFQGEWATAYSALFEDFRSGAVAFAVTWSPRWHQLNGSAVEGRVGVAAVPGLEPGPGSSNLGSYYLGVNAFSAHPDEAVEFIRFMSGPQAQAARLDLLGEIPAHPNLMAEPTRAAAHPAVISIAPILSRGGIRPRVADERALGAILEAAFHDVVLSGVPAAPALSRAAERIRVEIGDVPPSVTAPARSETRPDDRHAWTRPVRVGAGLLLVLLGGVMVVMFGRYRWGWGVLVTLQGKLLLAGASGMILLAVSSTAVATSLVFRSQQREIEQHRAFFAERVRDQAEALSKSTGLALSILDEQVAHRPVEDQKAVLAQLLMVSQFTEDIVFVELLDRDGGLRLSDRQTLFLSDSEPPKRPPTPDMLSELVASRGVHTYENRDESGMWVEVVVPLFREGVHGGALRLGFSRARFDLILEETELRHDAALAELSRAIGLTGLGLLLLCLGGVVVFARRLARPVEELTSVAAQVRGGDLAHDIQPSSRDEIGTLAETMGEMVQGLRDRDFIRDAFGRYLTRELAERLVADPGALQLGGHERTVTILMSDLRGFSGLSERLGPEAMVVLLNRYLAAMTDVILLHRGMINEFIGDAILVLFGALETQEDDVDRALRCALDMQRALRDFNLENEVRGLPVLDMGIGVNTGTVVAGNIGSEQRVKYGVVGPPVNHAARLESLTIGSQIYVSASSIGASQLTVRSRGPLAVSVKGSAKPLTYCELLGIEGAPELDAVEPGSARIDLEIPARFACLDGKRVPEERITSGTAAVGARTVVLRGHTSLKIRESIVLELSLPNHGWTGPLWAKVIAIEAETVELALTSGDPDDLALLRALTSAHS